MRLNSKRYLLNNAQSDTVAVVKGTGITPTKYEKGSSLHPEDTPTDKFHTQWVIRNELKYSTNKKEPLRALLEYLFPKTHIPVSIDATFDALSGISYVNNKWTQAPGISRGDTGQREAELTDFFDGIITAALGTKPGLEAPRSWSAEFTELSLQAEDDNEIKRKPDVLAVKPRWLVPDATTLEKRLKWKVIDIVGEVRMGTSALVSDLRYELAEKARCMFQAQWNRRFVDMFGIVRNTCFLSVFNRAGALHTEAFDIHKEPKLLIHLVLGLTFCSDERLGWDPMFTINTEGPSTIMFDGQLYEIVECVWKSEVIAGRATQCFIVTRNGEYFVLKDVWVTRYRTPTEVYFVRKAAAAGVRNMPRLYKCENVVINGAKDITLSGLGSEKIEERIHRRYLFSDCGVPLWRFKSIREFLNVLADAVTAHKDLYFLAGILHRDISIWNIMIHVDPSLPEEEQLLLRRGLLINLDYALETFLGTFGQIKDYAETTSGEDSTESDSESKRRRAFSLSEYETEHPKTMAEKSGAASTSTAASKGKGVDPRERPSKKPNEQGTAKNTSKGKGVDPRERPSKNTDEQGTAKNTGGERKHRKRVAKPSVRGHRTGTRPFIAAHILMNAATPHRYYHDLESFLYVIIYACTKYTGPNGEFNKDEKLEDLPPYIQSWFYSPNTNMVGNSKNSYMTMEDPLFDEQCLSYFTDYMFDLGDLVNQIRTIVREESQRVFRGGEESPDAHDKIILALRTAARQWPIRETDNAKGPVFKRKREFEEPSSFVSYNVLPQKMGFATEGEGGSSKKARYQEPESEDEDIQEASSPEDVFS